jgi:predicted DNA-binding protein
MMDGASEQISIRVPVEALKRAEALKKPIGKNASIAALGKVTRSTVLKLALIRGLDALEKEYR